MRRCSKLVPLALSMILAGVPVAAGEARSTGETTIERVVEIARDAAAALDAEIDLRHAEDGLVAFPTGREEAPLVGQEPADAFLVYKFVVDGSGARFVVGYEFGRISLLGAPRGRRALARPREIHAELMARMRRAGIRLEEIEEPFLPPDDYRAYADELKEGVRAAAEEEPATPEPAAAAEPHCAAEGPGFTFDGDDDEAAAARLEEFLRDHRLEVKTRSEDVLGVERKGTLVVLQARTSKSGLDRLIASVGFVFRDGTDEGTANEIAEKLNRRVMGVKYSANAGGLIVQVQVSFVDRLSLAEIEAACDFLVGLQLATLVAAPELVGLLKR